MGLACESRANAPARKIVQAASDELSSTDAGSTTPPAAGTVRLAIPGTGVSLAVPPQLSLLPAGAQIADASGEISIVIVAGRPVSDLEEDEIWMQAFPHRVDRFAIDGAQATLYRRTRAEDGGGYDAWWLCIHQGDFGITVLGGYTGADSAAFAGLEPIVRSVRWTSTIIHADIAFGYELASPNAVELPAIATGGLNYMVRTGNSHLELSLMAMPATPDRVRGAALRCEALTFPGKQVEGPVLEVHENVQFCWGLTSQPNQSALSYVAFVETAEGGLLMVNGRSKSFLPNDVGRRVAAVLKTLERTR